MNPISLHDHAFMRLSLSERVELAQQLWDSVHADACAAPFTSDQLAELDRRIAVMDASEAASEPWEGDCDDLRSAPR